MSMTKGETTEVQHMVRKGFRAPEITRKIIEARCYVGYAETNLDVEAVMALEELTKGEEIMVTFWKARGFPTSKIVNLVLLNRHRPESYRLREAIKHK